MALAQICHDLWELLVAQDGSREGFEMLWKGFGLWEGLGGFRSLWDTLRVFGRLCEALEGFRRLWGRFGKRRWEAWEALGSL